MIRVVLPAPLRALARIDGEITVETDGPATVASVLDAIEAKHPALRGTMRDQLTRERRAFVRFFACRRDLSLLPASQLLPDDVQTGAEPLLIVGAMAGG
jgi:sulfur-carrier protein